MYVHIFLCITSSCPRGLTDFGMRGVRFAFQVSQKEVSVNSPLISIVRKKKKTFVKRQFKLIPEKYKTILHMQSSSLLGFLIKCFLIYMHEYKAYIGIDLKIKTNMR